MTASPPDVVLSVERPDPTELGRADGSDPSTGAAPGVHGRMPTLQSLHQDGTSASVRCTPHI
jgi:hypothetical protein